MCSYVHKVKIERNCLIMKKVLSILVVAVLCISVFATMASATSYGNLSADEVAQMLGIDEGDLDKINDLKEFAQELNGDANVTAAVVDANVTTAASGDAIGDILGGVDVAAIAESLTGGDDALTTITSIFEGLDLDLASLVDMISSAFSGGGLDLGAITSGLDLGSFDIGALIGGVAGGSDAGAAGGSGDTASAATDMVSSIMDGLTSGLSGLGIDTSMIEGLLDNDIVNFFANLYIGLGEVGGSEAEATTAPVVTTAPSTTAKPVVVTTTTPKTGDTSAVVAAIATLTVASGAAFVCLKKKED